MLLALLDSLSLMPLMSDQSKFSYVCVNVTFGYVLLLFVLYLIIFYRTLPPHPLPKLLVLWRLCPSASLCYPLQRAFSWGVGLPPPLPSYLCIYVLLVYCVKLLLYCIVPMYLCITCILCKTFALLHRLNIV